METALYYTLSTIAQTLAGALAILVAVVLFRLSTLGRVIEDGKAEMRARNIEPTQAWSVLRAGGFDALVEYLETKLNWSNVRNHGPLRTASDGHIPLIRIGAESIEGSMPPLPPLSPTWPCVSSPCPSRPA
jgi:hypothetical protein